MKKILFVFLLGFLAAISTHAATEPSLGDLGVTLGAGAGQAGAAHTLTVNVTAPFNLVPGCASGQTTGCVKQINIYTTTGPTKTLLFSIAAPVGAITSQTLTATSPSFSVMPGNLLVSATMISPDGVESAPITATVPVPMPPLSACNATLN